MRRTRRAFTLIELICVIAIMATLAAMVVAVGALARTMAYRKRAQAQLQQIESAIVEYKIKFGGIPQGGLSLVTNYLPMGFTYSNSLPLDPWNVPYQYSNAGTAYRLFSTGPSATNADDDIELRK